MIPPIHKRACLAENRRTRFDYEILETFEAGIVLTGHEAKSAKLRGIALEGARALVRGGEAYLVGAVITSFQPKNAPQNFAPDRTRTLLLNREEINRLAGENRQGLTIIPTKVYYGRRGVLKVEIALARGRKAHDKRELLKKRESLREIRTSSL